MAPYVCIIESVIIQNSISIGIHLITTYKHMSEKVIFWNQTIKCDKYIRIQLFFKYAEYARSKKLPLVFVATV